MTPSNNPNPQTCEASGCKAPTVATLALKDEDREINVCVEHLHDLGGQIPKNPATSDEVSGQFTEGVPAEQSHSTTKESEPDRLKAAAAHPRKTAVPNEVYTDAMPQSEGPDKQPEPCPTCGKTNFPIWNAKGECITCARDRVLGPLPTPPTETPQDWLDALFDEHNILASDTQTASRAEAKAAINARFEAALPPEIDLVSRRGIYAHNPAQEVYDRHQNDFREQAEAVWYNPQSKEAE